MMKRILLTFIIALFATSFTFGQDIYLTGEGEKKLGDTVLVWGEPTTSQIIFKAIFHNDTENGMNVRVVRHELFMLPNTMSTFCWAGSCYSPTVDTSNYLFIPAGAANDSLKPFSGDYSPNGVIGTSLVQYTFYDIDNPDQKVVVVAKYWASPEGIAEDAMRGGSVSNIYPNPATNSVNIDYQLTPNVNSAIVKIFNLLGSTVAETVMKKGGNRLKMDVSNLKNGIYFYAVVINGNIYKTKKLVIQH